KNDDDFAIRVLDCGIACRGTPAPRPLNAAERVRGSKRLDQLARAVGRTIDRYDHLELVGWKILPNERIELAAQQLPPLVGRDDDADGDAPKGQLSLLQPQSTASCSAPPRPLR